MAEGEEITEKDIWSGKLKYDDKLSTDFRAEAESVGAATNPDPKVLSKKREARTDARLKAEQASNQTNIPGPEETA